MQDIVIIGAGLTGLTLAYLLRDSNLNIIVVEGRNRIGGRIHTIANENMTTMEMGATWLGKKHIALLNILTELDIAIIEQEMGTTAFYEAISTSPPQIVKLPPNTDPTYRIKKGSSELINVLKDRLSSNTTILLNELVQSISFNKNQVVVETNNKKINCTKVISTLPPNLLAHSINITPKLPDDIMELIKRTHTWMGESIKIGLHYKTPFWIENNLSGTIVSNVGPIPEMYDHSNHETKQFALKGFFNGNYFSLKKEERLQKVLSQLKKYYGNKVEDFIHYEEKVWSQDPLTYTAYEQHVLPHQHNGHIKYKTSYFDNRFYIAGSETAEKYPGYMDGAVRSAQFIAQKLTETNTLNEI
jgi:monoamine oxidase